MNATTTCTNCGQEIIFAPQRAEGIVFSAWIYSNKMYARPYECDIIDGKLVLHAPAVSA